MTLVRMTDDAPLTVAVAGLGAVGLSVARFLDSTDLPIRLAAVSASSAESAKTKVLDFRSPPVFADIARLPDHAEVIVEALPPELFETAAWAAVKAGRILMPLSVTQLLHHLDLVDECRRTGARIIVPTGALLGLDAVRAAAEGNLRSVVMETRKPPAGLAKSPYVLEQGIDLSNLAEPLRLYKGSVRDAADKFPANVNVSVALSLAGLGPDHTEYEIWADPTVDRNTHRIRVEADEARFEMSIAGVPTVENPATGRLTPLSVIAALKALVSPLVVGS